MEQKYINGNKFVDVCVKYQVLICPACEGVELHKWDANTSKYTLVKKLAKGVTEHVTECGDYRLFNTNKCSCAVSVAYLEAPTTACPTEGTSCSEIDCGVSGNTCTLVVVDDCSEANGTGTDTSSNNSDDECPAPSAPPVVPAAGLPLFMSLQQLLCVDVCKSDELVGPTDSVLVCDGGKPVFKRLELDDKNTTYSFLVVNDYDGDGVIQIEVTATKSDGSTSTQTITFAETPSEQGEYFSGQPTINANGLVTFPTAQDEGEAAGTPVTLDLSSLIGSPHPTFTGAGAITATYNVDTNVWTIESEDDSSTMVNNGDGTYTYQPIDNDGNAIGAATVIDTNDNECVEFNNPAINLCDVNLLGCEGGNKVNVPLSDIKSDTVVCGLENAVRTEYMHVTHADKVGPVGADGQTYNFYFAANISGAAGVLTVEVTSGSSIFHEDALGAAYASLRTTSLAIGAEYDLRWAISQLPTLNANGCPLATESILAHIGDIDTNNNESEGSCLILGDGDWTVSATPVDTGYSETSPGVFCTDPTQPNGQPSMFGEAPIPLRVGGAVEASVDAPPSDWISPRIIHKYQRPVQVHLDCNGDFVKAFDIYGDEISQDLITY